MPFSLSLPLYFTSHVLSDQCQDDEKARLLVKGELQSFTMEKRYIRKDGEIVWANLTVSLARNPSGEPQYFIGIIQDISDRKRSEQQLQSEKLRLQLALEAMEMGTWESNLDTGIWSARTEAIFGYEPGAFASDHKAFLKLVHLEDQERVFQSLHHSFTTHSPYNIEYRINLNDGEIRWVAVNGKVVEKEEGDGFRIVGVVRDITDLHHPLKLSQDNFSGWWRSLQSGWLWLTKTIRIAWSIKFI